MLTAIDTALRAAANWHEFLAVIRHFANKLQVTARDVERALFDAHRSYQRGTLYRPRTTAARAR